MLVRARTDYHPDKPERPKKDNLNKNCCNTPNCDLCSKIDRSGSVKSETTGKTHKTMWNVTCKSSNVIYVLTCKICGMQYVGQTKRTLGKRLDEHLGRIEAGEGDNDVPTHFKKPGHHGKDDVTISVLDFVYRHPLSDRALELRLLIEFNWIHRLKTQTPKGMNTMDNQYGQGRSHKTKQSNVTIFLLIYTKVYMRRKI